MQLEDKMIGIIRRAYGDTPLVRQVRPLEGSIEYHEWLSLLTLEYHDALIMLSTQAWKGKASEVKLEGMPPLPLRPARV